MSRKRRFKPQATGHDSARISLENISSLPVAVYYRQSTTAQVGNISTSIQTIDMIEELKKRGWKEQDIILIDDDEGVSGTTRIDERKGMKYLFELIADKKIGAVAVQDEDRLFRDLTQIQVNIFIDTCRKSQVRVITPYFIYDFSHPAHGEFHARQFRFKCDMAAEYIKSYIQGRLTPARQRLRREGKWAGSATPTGYMVDVREKLEDGSQNPNWKKFVPFEPHAEIIRQYYSIFIKHNGAIRRSMKYIQENQISFPDVALPDGFRNNSALHKRTDGYFVNRTNFVRMLTNPVYIGHWMIKGSIAIWDNHEPIVSPKIFMRAFNYLSPYTLTGEENPNYRPAYQHEPPKSAENRDVERPLCVGMIYSTVDDRTFQAGIVFDNRTNQYLYVLQRPEIEGSYVDWARRASWIDQAIVGCLKSKLEATYNHEAWQASIKDTAKLVERERKIIQLQLTSLKEEKENLITSLGTLKHQFMIQKVETRYVQVELEEKRLQSELANLEDQSKQHISVDEAHLLFKQVIEDWDGLTLDERRNVLSLFADHIKASDYNRSGEMLLTIHWKDGSSDEIEIWFKPKSKHWTMENTRKLLTMFDEGKNQLEIAQEFPNLKWYQIFNEIKKHRGRIRFPVSYMRKNETYQDYLEMGGRKGKATCSLWRPEEIEELKKMIEEGTTRLELMRQFPVRRYKQLREKIKEVCGKLPSIPNPDEVSQDLTYYEYAQERKIDNSDPGSEI